MRRTGENLWWHYAKNIINDFTENGILLYIGAGATQESDDEADDSGSGT